jgi:hypothetical protein
MGDKRNVAIFGLSVALAFCLGALVSGAPAPLLAQQKTTSYANANSDANRRFIAATGSVGSGMSVLWLVDTETQRLLVYGTSNLGKSVELRAARKIEYDFRLNAYRDDSQYAPEDLEELWRKKQGKSGKGPAGPAEKPGGGTKK